MDPISILTKKSATCEDLILCLYDLSSTEARVFVELIAAGTSTTDDIAAKLERDRSTVHRALSKLVSIGLCYKETRTLEDGGYFHVYTLAETSKIKEQVGARVHDICTSLQKLLDNFDSDFRRVQR
ncbi:MAG: MarR family transcriptional regulator [Nitrososphaerota archaeon]|nr:MarR family transcriptional regulator [Nitrososphaerota archaeon]